MVEPHAAGLRARGEQVAVIIATDGLPNHKGTFLRAMQALQCLPVWVVVRLCTDDDGVVDYWNDLDRQLEAPLEVLDDLASEAKEVTQLNPWLNYAQPLHLCRLFGLPGKLYDALDETRLLPFQAQQFCEDLLGVELPQAEVSEEQFLEGIKTALADLAPVLNPLTMRPKD